MTSQKLVSNSEKILSLSVNAIALFNIVIGVAASTLLNFFNGFLNKPFLLKGWVIILCFVILMLIHFIIRLIVLRIKHKRLFKVGDHVQVKHETYYYQVTGYFFWKPDMVNCRCTHDGKDYKIIQAILEHA